MSRRLAEHTRQGIDYAETAAGQDLEASLQREKRDRRVTIKPFSLWMLVVWAFLFFFAGFFSARHGPDFIGTTVNRGSPSSAQSTPQALQKSTASGSTGQSTAAAANGAVVAFVTIKNMKFLPATIEIKKGDIVEWKNDDITPHTATGATFDSASITPEASWRHTFTDPGSVPYTCTFHPDMKGNIIVK